MRKIPFIQSNNRLFVDMDGTLARFHDEVQYIERMYEKGFFENLKPFENAVKGIKELIQNNANLEVFILSATVDGEPPYCQEEKHKWIDTYLPEIDKRHRIFTKVGKNKAEFIPYGITSTDYLYDDYNKNLDEWQQSGGEAIKCKNNINHKGEIGPLWEGNLIDNCLQPNDFAYEICSIIDNKQYGQVINGFQDKKR